MGALDETDDHDRVPRVDEIAQGLDDLEDVLRPPAGLRIGHEVVAVAEHRVNALLPRAGVQRAASRGDRAGSQALAQAPVRVDLLQHQLHQPSVSSPAR